MRTFAGEIVLSIKAWISDEVNVRFFNVIGRSILDIDDEWRVSFDDAIERPPSFILFGVSEEISFSILTRSVSDFDVECKRVFRVIRLVFV